MTLLLRLQELGMYTIHYLHASTCGYHVLEAHLCTHLPRP